MSCNRVCNKCDLITLCSGFELPFGFSSLTSERMFMGDLSQDIRLTLTRLYLHVIYQCRVAIEGNVAAE